TPGDRPPGRDTEVMHPGSEAGTVKWRQPLMDRLSAVNPGQRRLALLAAAAFLFSFRLAAASPERKVANPLDGVKELGKPVSYTETKIPLGELVAKVGADTGVALTASAEVADEPVAVVVKELPARELLEQVADLLDYRWSRH